jgi:DNA-binding PadR family transcriptional regulator
VKVTEKDMLEALEELEKDGLIERIMVDGIEKWRITEKGIETTKNPINLVSEP